VYNISWSWGWGTTTEMLGHTWSLGVEEQFYLVWPWIILLFMRKNSIHILMWVLLFFIPLSWWLTAHNIYHPIVSSVIKESIFLGSLCAIMIHRGWLKNIPPALVWLALFLILFVGIFCSPPGSQTTIGAIPFALPFGFFNAAAVLSLVVIAGILANPHHSITKLLSIEPLVFMGKISYALYLWHVPVFRWFALNKALPGSVNFILKFVVTFAVAIASWYLVEKGATAAGRRWSKRITDNP
jgi:peptidoglycan/LPS O-acetylase OafA/YrhL